MTTRRDLAAARLSLLGHDDVELIGHGIEGDVFRLGAGKVAKVWSTRRARDLQPMIAFYADVAAADPPITTPLIESVLTVDGMAVTIERELPGEPLQGRLSFTAELIPDWAVDAVVQCLAALRTVPGSAAMRALVVVEETTPFRTPGDSFAGALVSLLDRRVYSAGPALGAALPDFPRRYQSLRSQLLALDQVEDTVLHGDLLGGNIHIDAHRQPVAILDFGFLTTCGDPRFDAAVSAGVMNMYGPHARQITTDLTTQLARRLDYDPAVLDLYRAAYAVATSTVFGADLDDGHFRWCVDQLAGAAVLSDGAARPRTPEGSWPDRVSALPCRTPLGEPVVPR